MKLIRSLASLCSSPILFLKCNCGTTDKWFNMKIKKNTLWDKYIILLSFGAGDEHVTWELSVMRKMDYRTCSILHQSAKLTGFKDISPCGINRQRSTFFFRQGNLLYILESVSVSYICMDPVNHFRTSGRIHYPLKTIMCLYILLLWQETWKFIAWNVIVKYKLVFSMKQ